MSFFIRKKGLNSNSTNSGDRKRKNQTSKSNFTNKDSDKSKPPKSKKAFKRRDADDEELDSDFEEEVALNPVRQDEEAESEEDINETAQEKRLRLAKIYLKEIEREEKERAEAGQIDSDVIANRLKDDFLESTGKLKKRVADNYTSVDIENINVLKCKDHRFSITCLVISSDNAHIYSGSKDGGIVKWSFSDRRKVKSLPRRKKGNDSNNGHMSSVLCLAISTDNCYLVSGGGGNNIFVWNPETLEHVHTFTGHRGVVTGLAFRQNTHQLFSASQDRSVKVWSLTEMSYTETLFGHQSGVTSVDALSRERAITSGGRDNTVRIWKIVEESQLVFNGHKGSIDCVRLLSEENFLSAGDDGDLCIWGTMKKRPLAVVSKAHGIQSENQNPNWISSIATFLNTDLVASGSCDGLIRLWKCTVGFRSLEPVMEIPVQGFVNSLVFTLDGSHLVAGVGQEHRLGRWWRIGAAVNAIYVIPLNRKTPTGMKN